MRAAIAGERRRKGGGRRRERHCDRAAVQEFREGRADDDERGRGDRSGQPQQPDVDAKELSRRSDEGRERRLIDVAEIGTPAADDEIELVAHRVVTAAKREMHERRRNRDRRDERQGRIARQAGGPRLERGGCLSRKGFGSY